MKGSEGPTTWCRYVGTDSNVDCIHPSFVPSALDRFLALSVESRPVGGMCCGIEPSVYREIRCDTFI